MFAAESAGTHSSSMPQGVKRNWPQEVPLVKADQPIFKGRKVYLASDLGLRPNLEKSLKERVQEAGGTCWSWGVDGAEVMQDLEGDQWERRRRAEKALKEADTVVTRAREGWEFWTVSRSAFLSSFVALMSVRNAIGLRSGEDDRQPRLDVPRLRFVQARLSPRPHSSLPSPRRTGSRIRELPHDHLQLRRPHSRLRPNAHRDVRQQVRRLNDQEHFLRRLRFVRSPPLFLNSADPPLHSATTAPKLANRNRGTSPASHTSGSKPASSPGPLSTPCSRPATRPTSAPKPTTPPSSGLRRSRAERSRNGRIRRRRRRRGSRRWNRCRRGRRK